MIAYGFSCGYSSPTNPLLMSENSPLPSGKITDDEASWIAALTCGGGVVGNTVAGFITNRFGRKLPLLLLAIPKIVSTHFIQKNSIINSSLF